VVVLDEAMWRSQLAADPAVVGRTLTLDGKPYTVAGVLPHLRFRNAQEYEMWTTVAPAELAEQRRDQRGATVFARLRPGATPEAAAEELAVIGRRLAAQYPKESGGWTFRMEPAGAWVAGSLRPALLVLLGAVALVLLVACTNVAHMLLARASQRGHEMAVRTALGATRLRLVRQMLTESLALALAGSAAGLALAYLLLPVLLGVAPLDDAQRAAVSIDARVLGFALAAAAVATVLFGLWPAVVASRADVQSALKGEGGRGATGRGGWRTRGALVVSEVALASVLLAGAGLLLKSFEGLQRVERGYDPTLVASVGVVLPDNVYPKGADKREFVRRVLEQLRATPGVEAAAVVNFLPRFGATQGEISVAGRTETMAPEARQASWRVATPDYFRALRIPVRRGRGIEEGDGPKAAQVVVVSETFAARFFPGVDPVGPRDHPLGLRPAEAAARGGRRRRRAPRRPHRGRGARRLPAVRAELVGLHERGRPRAADHRGRAPGRPRARGARGRPGAPGVLADRARRRREQRRRAAPVRRRPHVALRRHRRAARLPRHLRRDGLRRGGAHARDRHPHRARRPAARGARAGAAPGARARRRGRGGRRGRGARRRSACSRPSSTACAPPTRACSPAPPRCSCSSARPPATSRRAAPPASTPSPRSAASEGRAARPSLAAARSTLHAPEPHRRMFSSTPPAPAPADPAGPAAPAGPLISLRNVEKAHKLAGGLSYVLRRITLDIAPGEFVTVMGPSGAGKSTLLSILGCSTAPSPASTTSPAPRCTPSRPSSARSSAAVTWASCSSSTTCSTTSPWPRTSTCRSTTAG
jgi:hypothetical protein